jgi:hypothetical protein
LRKAFGARMARRKFWRASPSNANAHRVRRPDATLENETKR